MPNTLMNVSSQMADTADTAGRSVVRVDARRRMPASGIIWNAEGVIVTAHHVVRRDEDITVGLADGRTVAAALVGRDPTTDLAVLRIQADGLPPLPPAADRPRVGELVLALARPGRTIQATLGVVSAVGEEGWRTPMDGQIDTYLQTDVLMYPGFSGGPLVSAGGQMVGLNTSAILRGVSLTIPASTVRRVVEALLAHGRIRRGYLGVSTQRVQLPDPLARELAQDTGLLVAAVEPGGPADQAGLLLGDTIVGLDDMPIRRHEDLLHSLTPERVGTTASLRIIRSGKVEALPVVVGEQS